MQDRPPADEESPVDPLEQLINPPEPQEERPPPLILWGAGIGLLIGLLLWGSFAFSAVSGMTGLFDGEGPDNSNAAGTVIPADATGTPIDCATFRQGRALTPEEEAAFDAQCGSPTPGPNATPADASVNREDCDAIRGTSYRSTEERQWFLDHCVTR
jgi:hypothetical protein